MQRLFSVFNEWAFTDWSKLLSNSTDGASGHQITPKLGAARVLSRRLLRPFVTGGRLRKIDHHLAAHCCTMHS
jgi:hypothetical protein